MKQSIYEQIHSAVNKNGQLDSDFSLPSEDTNGDIIFAPGARRITQRQKEYLKTLKR